MLSMKFNSTRELIVLNVLVGESLAVLATFSNDPRVTALTISSLLQKAILKSRHDEMDIWKQKICY